MTNTPVTTLYEQDFYLWLEQTAELLKTGKFEKLDVANLIEEIETMGRSEKKSIESNLEMILVHLLKYKYQPNKRSNSWRVTLLEHRQRLSRDFRNSPSLKRHFLETFAHCYQGARKMASVETEITIATFSLECPFTAEQVLDEDFLPE
ncbi:hypothetical protein GlitD10_0419 [Gloeomargarita lithophora Alchichica-D10]|uniref:DUF29 domain-containing protein n=1 Tax=Gloeomargarita lithophora Alchichica-D10 TaxID=1188229 RepID=A0A1J0A9W8_9CYAN|nr:DUF29 domain-containing protein [Gloeomargarita lithophora]APB32730.1 hypothetical protein GlitD10_0419 [Gloeomargarita lithophora Alchichica-D10]